ncbi:MAG: hypothetical protein ACYCSB_00840 [bacterium]|jgi:hypothetical protein
MENIKITQIKDGIHIEGYPNAVKFISIQDGKAQRAKMVKRLSDLWSHKIDLDLAAASLEAINLLPEDKQIVRQSLWRSSIIHFTKCFGKSKGRFNLSAEKIWKDEEERDLILKIYKYFSNLRNKHIVHDENSYAQCKTGAVLNKGDKDYKIEKIITVSFIAETLSQDNYNSLFNLIITAKDWIAKEYNEICEKLTKELEQESYETLFSYNSMEYKVPEINDIDKTRNS